MAPPSKPDEARARQGGPGRSNRLLLGLLTVGIAWAGVELLSLAAFFAIREGGFSYSELRSTRSELVSALESGQIAGPELEVVHPYLGFVYDPAGNSPERTEHHGGLPISDFGFIDDAPPLRAVPEDAVVVGLFGGSFAHYFSVHGLPALLEGLQEAPEFRGRELSVVRVALGGFKQPQQLLALSYLLALGARFDVVINLDGFNEVALPPKENLPKGVFPFYPRNWSTRLGGLPGHDAQVAMLRIADLRERRQSWAGFVDDSLLRFSVAANAIWWLRDRQLAIQMAHAQMSLAELKADGQRYEVSGPKRVYANEPELYEDLANVWFNASLAMHRLCEASGIRYWHFLQPNQYVSNSKPMSEAERDVALQPPQFYRQPVERGYPVLRRRGPDLVAAGVRFHDLSLAFRDHSEPLYSDSCCHVNERGNAIIGRAMASRMLADLLEGSADSDPATAENPGGAPAP